MKSNTDIRDYARNKGVFLYQIGFAMGVSEPTIIRKLRFELTDSEKADMITLIDRIAAEKSATVAAK